MNEEEFFKSVIIRNRILFCIGINCNECPLKPDCWDKKMKYPDIEINEVILKKLKEWKLKNE